MTQTFRKKSAESGVREPRDRQPAITRKLAILGMLSVAAAILGVVVPFRRPAVGTAANETTASRSTPTSYPAAASTNDATSAAMSVESATVPPAPTPPSPPTGTSADVCRQTWTYDSEGNVLTHTDRRGITTINAYDRENRLVSESRAGLMLQSMERDTEGNVHRQTDALGRTTAFTYDKANRKLSEDRAGQAVEHWIYTPLGDVARYIDADGRATTNTYTPRRLLESESLAGETTRYTYDGAGHRLSRERPNGPDSTWTYAYDTAGNLTTVTDPNDHATTFGYDANNNRTRVTDANDHVTAFAYDERNRLKGKAYLGGDGWSWAYDGDNNRTRSAAPNGRVAETTYDALNRPTRTTYLGATTGEVQSTAFTYDGNGNTRTISETSSVGTRTETRDYDDFDRLIHVVDGNGRSLDYAYDDVGNRTRMTDADGHDTAWTYNDLNQNTRVTAPGMGTTNLGYAPSGRVTEISRPDGSLTEQVYFDNGRLQSIRHSQAGSTLARYDYVYDPNGNRTEQREFNGPATADATQHTHYVYDDADRLIETREPNRTTTYTFDAVGNRIGERVVDGNGVVISNSTVNYNERDQLTRRSDPVANVQVEQTWDANGNLATQTVNGQPPRIYSYDARDRLVGLNLPNAASGPTTLHFAYHADGLRREKTDGVTTTRYQYDGQSLLAETNAIGNTLRQFHYSATQLIGQTQAGTTPVHRHVLLDALRSPIALLDPTGPVTARTSYDAFGKIRAQLSTNGMLTTPDRDAATAELISTDNQPIGFTGYLKDTESGLYYARARYYDPATARFTTEDPEAGKDLEPPSLHRYLYAYANPTTYVDPNGRQSVDSPQYALQQTLNMAGSPRQREAIANAIARYEAERPAIAQASLRGFAFGTLIALPGATYVRAVYSFGRSAYATYSTYGATAAVLEHGAAATALTGIGAEAGYGLATGAIAPSATTVLPVGATAAEARAVASTAKIGGEPPVPVITPARLGGTAPLAGTADTLASLSGKATSVTVSEGASGNSAVAASAPWQASPQASGLSFQELRALRVAGLSREEIARHLEVNGDIYLFRGTSPGWEGSPAARSSATSASTDPYIATVFATEARGQSGRGVVLFGSRSEVGTFSRGNWMAEEEREVGLTISALQFAQRAPSAIPVDRSRLALEEMGMPPIPQYLQSKTDRRDLIIESPKMTPEQIFEYMQRMKAGD